MLMVLGGPPPTTVPDLPAGCSLSFDTSFIFYGATGTPSGRRHYLVPGLYGAIGQWDTEPFLSCANTWRASGDELVSMAHPVFAACFFTNGGWQYRDWFNDALNTVKNAVEAAHGSARVNIAGGMSYGGLHSMIAAVCNDWVGAYWAHLPVTRLDALAEFAGVGNVPRFNPQYEIAGLAQKPGRISYSLSDGRVNGSLTEAIVNQLPSTVDRQEYPGIGHNAYPSHGVDIDNWLAAI